MQLHCLACTAALIRASRSVNRSPNAIYHKLMKASLELTTALFGLFHFLSTEPRSQSNLCIPSSPVSDECLLVVNLPFSFIHIHSQQIPFPVVVWKKMAVLLFLPCQDSGSIFRGAQSLRLRGLKRCTAFVFGSLPLLCLQLSNLTGVMLCLASQTPGSMLVHKNQRLSS